MNRIYQITRERRDEDVADDLPTGNPTVHIAQDRQKLKVFDEKPEETEIEDDEIYGVSQSQDILYTSNTVTEGDFNPVTSDAVAKHTKDIQDTLDKQNEIETAQCTINQAEISGNINRVIKRNGIAQLQLRLLKEGTTTMIPIIATLPEGFRPIQEYDVTANCWTDAPYPLQFRIHPNGNIQNLSGSVTASRIDTYISATYLVAEE